MIRKFSKEDGFTLIETVIVIIVMGILAGVATMKFSAMTETSRIEATKAEMAALADAIIGNPDVTAGGVQGDFGYVGDVGALPPNLQALAVNPGYATWDGPYVSSDFDSIAYQRDPWNADYQLIGTTIRSIGSGSNIDRIIASNAAQLFSNSVLGAVLDVNATPPGATYKDSVTIQLIYPDGAGGTTIAALTPGGGGNYSFSGIPIGRHRLRAIYTPSSDTVEQSVSISPGATAKIKLTFPADLW